MPEPLETVAAVPKAAFPSMSCTCPFAPTDAATLMVNLKPVGSLEASFALFTAIVVVVATGPPPPELLLHPIVKVRTQRRPSPNAARYFFCPGRNSRNTAARPVPALSIHQPLPPFD